MLGKRRKIEARFRQETSQEAQLKVFLAGRVGIEAGEVSLDERVFPGRQGRLLFAYLATAAPGRPIPHDELAELLWGDAPPATWDKALSVLVSKLRGVLAEAGIDGGSALTAAFGCYRLGLPAGTWVDVVEAESAVQEAESSLAAGDLETAHDAAAFAESVVRLPFLPGDDGPWVATKRRELADLRLRALSALAEASLAAGDPAEAIRWAEQEVQVEPFREGGYRRLMAAHAAAGNRAEALQVYERCRRFLAEELGAYPSPETESLYRSLLATPSRETETEDTPPSPGAPRSRATRRTRPALVAALLVVLLAVVAAGAALAIVATRDGGLGASAAARTPRIALVVPSSAPANDDPSSQYVAALEHARSAYGVQTQTFAIDLSKPGLPRRVRDDIGKFGLVLLGGQFVDTRFVHVMALYPHTRFVALDPDPNNSTTLGPAGSKDRNATDVFFVTGPGAYLAGYLTALMVKREDAGKRRVTVSLIASDLSLNENEIEGFSDGVADAVPGADILEGFSHDSSNPSVCETIANRQIDQGSKAVFADAGACSIGALSAVGVRGVWGIGADQNMSSLGPQILVSTVKRLGQAVDYAINSYLAGTLPRGHLDIGIERDAVGIIGINPVVPASIRAKLVQVQQLNMAEWTSWATPMK